MSQKIPYPDDPRVETGAVQFGDDWPGLFLRGDEAIHLSFLVNSLIQSLSEDQKRLMQFEVNYLNSLISLIQNEVVVK
jgi:hypothetical protein